MPLPQVGALEAEVDVVHPSLTDPERGAEQWNWMVKVLTLASAGLVKYLMDAMPDNLPEYDPQ